jgi:hypothetical protein
MKAIIIIIIKVKVRTMTFFMTSPKSASLISHFINLDEQEI